MGHLGNRAHEQKGPVMASWLIGHMGNGHMADRTHRQ